MKNRRLREGFVYIILNWIRKDYIVKLAIFLALINIFFYVYSGIVPNPYSDGYVGKFENDSNSDYAVASVGIRDLQVADGIVEISYIYRYQPFLWSESHKVNVDMSQNPAYFISWDSIPNELPPPPQLPGQVQIISMTVNVPPPLEMLKQYDSLIKSSGNSFWFPLDKYDFRFSISAMLPDSVEIIRTQDVNSKMKEIPFGFHVYSWLNGLKIKAIPEADNTLHIIIQRPIWVILLYVMPIVALLLILILIGLKSDLDFFASNKGMLAFLSLVLGLIPILLSFLFIPAGVQRPNLLDCVEYPLISILIIVVVVAYIKREIQEKT
jgi:hypothetical protein